MTLKHLSNLSVVTAEKAHQLTALTEKLLYTEVGSRVATERFKISVPISSPEIKHSNSWEIALSKQVLPKICI